MGLSAFNITCNAPAPPHPSGWFEDGNTSLLAHGGTRLALCYSSARRLFRLCPGKHAWQGESLENSNSSELYLDLA